MRLGLRGKFLLPILLTVFVGMAMSVSLSYLRATAAIEEAIGAGMEREVRLTVRHIDHWLSNRRTDAQTWSREDVYRDAIVQKGDSGKTARQEASHDLQHLREGYPYYNAIALFDSNGDVVAASNFEQSRDINVGDRAYFRQAIRGRECVSEVLAERLRGDDVFVIASPVLDDSRVVGVLGCLVDLDAFSAQFIDNFKLREGYAYIADARGRVFASSARSDERFADLGRYVFGREMLRRDNGSIIYTRGGVKQIACFQTSEDVGWMFVVAQSLDAALASTYATGKYGALTGLGVLLFVVLIIGVLFRRSIQARLDEMLRVIERVDAGDLDARVEGALNADEVGVLMRAFNTMTSRLKCTLSALNEEIHVRKKAEQELAAHRDSLEELVTERTKALTSSNEELRRSIADRERAEAAMQKAKDIAEAANRAKSEFLANMSHEIRTPMTAILGFADMLLDSGNQTDLISKTQADAARTIRRNGEYLLGIINDILDLSKIEAGRMTIERIACSPRDIMTEIANLIRVRAEAKGLAFRIQCDGPMPETIATDPTRLRQILINLIGNAIKFTESGNVSLFARCRPDAASPTIEFDVVDTGVGMTARQITSLFQPFVQADTSTTRRFGGTGLGLTISQRFAHLLGGSISVVESKPGEGSRFRVTIDPGSLENVRMIGSQSTEPIGRRDGEADTPAGNALSLKGCSVLLAEDGQDNQRLVAHLLRKVGGTVRIVEDGRQAVDAAQAAKRDGRPHHVILMDMQMPVMDGYAATAELRRLEYSGPIIALTAHAMAGDRQACLDAGCDDYLTKPVDRSLLVRTVFDHWQSSRVAPLPKA